MSITSQVLLALTEREEILCVLQRIRREPLLPAVRCCCCRRWSWQDNNSECTEFATGSVRLAVQQFAVLYSVKLSDRHSGGRRQQRLPAGRCLTQAGKQADARLPLSLHCVQWERLQFRRTEWETRARAIACRIDTNARITINYNL